MERNPDWNVFLNMILQSYYPTPAMNEIAISFKYLQIAKQKRLLLRNEFHQSKHGVYK